MYVDVAHHALTFYIAHSLGVGEWRRSFSKGYALSIDSMEAIRHEEQRDAHCSGERHW